MERDYGPKPTMAWIDINKLVSDDTYQRDLSGTRSKNNINKIMCNFSWSEFTPLTVVKRKDGMYNIVDGQHRFVASKELKNIPELPCWIIPDATVKEQANTFIDVNRNRVFTSPYDLFKAQIAAGDPAALAVRNFCQKLGIVIPFTGYCQLPFMTLALASIRKHLKFHNDGYLEWAIRCIRSAYPEKMGQMKADIINTLVYIKCEYGQKVKEDDVIKTLLSFESVNRISAKAKELKALDASLCFNEAHRKVFVSKLNEVKQNGPKYK